MLFQVIIFQDRDNGRVLVTDFRNGCYFADMNDIITGVNVVRKVASSNICKIMMEGDK